MVYLSPTNFDSARMPRTVTASVFTNAKTTAHSLRVQINKSLKKCDQQVQILEELDQLITTEGEENSDNEDEFSEVQSGLIVAFDKIKKWNNEHSDTCFQLQRMCNFMIEAEVTVGAVESANKQEARSIMVLSEKHEVETDGGVSKWRKDNGKWLRKRKRVEKTEVQQERGRGQSLDIGRAKMVERLCEVFKPSTLLSDDGNLKNKNEFKAVDQ